MFISIQKINQKLIARSKRRSRLPSGSGTERAQAELKSLAVSLDMFPLNNLKLRIDHAEEKFTQVGGLKSHKDKDSVTEYLFELKKLAELLMLK